MSGEPRIVIVAGARDHPAQIDDDDISRRAVAAIWKQGALPFETSEPAVCDGIAQGHYGMTFSLVSRNLTAAQPGRARSRPTSTTPRCCSTRATSGPSATSRR